MGEKHFYGDVYIENKKVLTNNSKSVTLSASKWSNNSQTVSVNGVTSSTNVFVSPVGNPKTYAEAGIYCSAQANNSLTFTYENTPTTDIKVNILIMG